MVLANLPLHVGGKYTPGSSGTSTAEVCYKKHTPSEDRAWEPGVYFPKPPN